MMNEFEFGWVVGFLEGEGSFFWNRGPTVKATQADLQPLLRLQEWYGGSIQEQAPRRGLIDQKKVWHWRVTGMRARNLLLELMPHMSLRRQSQIQWALDGESGLQSEAVEGSAARLLRR